MAKATIKDVYPQFMYLNVTMSAADTLTWGRASVGISIFDYAAFLINRIEWSFSRASWFELTNSNDVMWAALTGSNTLADLDLDQSQVYDQIEVFRDDIGTAATAIETRQPIVKDFESFPGGGLLVPAQDMYIGMSSSGFAAAGSVSCRVYFTVKELEAADYLELAQRLRVIST